MEKKERKRFTFESSCLRVLLEAQLITHRYIFNIFAQFFLSVFPKLV